MARKEKQYHFIYKTTNLLNGKYYYGMHSTNNLDDGYLGSGKRLRYSINKYGKENHKREIIEFLENRKELIEREKEIVSLNEIAKEDCMNLMIGGSGTLNGLSEESLNKIRNGASKYMINFWKNVNNDFVIKMNKIKGNVMKNNHINGKINYNTFTGKHHSEKTKELMKLAKIGYGIGKNNSQFDTCWITKDNINKKIKKSDLNSYVELGWVKGRVI